MRFKKLIKRYFKKGNVCVFGLRGTGKDLIFGNVIARRKKDYISNLNYSKDKNYIKLNFHNLNLGLNTYNNLINNNIKYYDFKDFYPVGTDIYVSDSGIYFPSQYCNELNKEFRHFPMYLALSRQVSENNFHINTQALNRVWDKIREQSDIYIMCRKCIYIPLTKLSIFNIRFFRHDFVIQFIRLYERYDSAIQKMNPCRIKVPLLNKQAKTNARIYIDQFNSTNGFIKNKILFYRNKSKHDTLYFSKLFERGVKNEKN